MDKLLYRWLHQLACCYNGDLLPLEASFPCVSALQKSGQDLLLATPHLCSRCTDHSGCSDNSYRIIFSISDTYYLLQCGVEFPDRLRPELAALLSITVRLARRFPEQNLDKKLNLLQDAIRYHFGRSLHRFYLTGCGISLGKGFTSGFIDQLPPIEETGEGKIDQEGEEIYYKNFYRGSNLLGTCYWEPRDNQPQPLKFNRPVTSSAMMIGRNKAYMDAMRLVHQAAASDNTIMLRGESGTGKELFAHTIHLLSPRCQHPFIAINCAAIPENLLESELFGYNEGSFTGARRGGKPGKFELADGGTIFLDEIGDMPLPLQAKLLRVLQEKRVERVGGTSSINIDIRVIAATHHNLEEQIRKGLFRSDLYFRLNVIPIYLPALRERKEDIELLLNYYLKKQCLLQNKPFKIFTREAITHLKRYEWPGNIRELENVVAYGVSVCNKDLIDLNDLRPLLHGSETDGQLRTTSVHRRRKGVPNREELVDLLDHYGRSTAAKKKIAGELGISLATLYRWLQRQRVK